MSERGRVALVIMIVALALAAAIMFRYTVTDCWQAPNLRNGACAVLDRWTGEVTHRPL